jgi:phosphoribosylformylglycinamidine cyclo-ligase
MATAEQYRAAGVDLDAAAAAKRRIAAALATARSPLALGAIGGFGGMVSLPADVDDPVLVMSTDGVGTKVLVAIRAGKHDTVGEDLVNHCVNDVLVHGARAVAFQDYIATAAVDPDTVAALVEGVARGCRAHEMTLTGGETAELPDLYHPGHYDLAGTILGVVARKNALHGDRVVQGDVLVGYASNGLHTNGYTLARRVFFDRMGLDVGDAVPELGHTVGDELLRVHRSYARAITPALSEMHGLAHITGGGIPGNLSRTLPEGCGAAVDASAWPIPAVFSVLQEAGHVARDEMFDVFNMGIGMIGVAPSSVVPQLRTSASAAGIDTWIIGEVTAGSGVHVR